MDLQSKRPEDIQALLTDLQTKFQSGKDQMSLDERKKLCEMLGDVVRKASSMEKSVKEVVNTSDHEGMTLKVCGQFPRTANGLFVVPTREEFTSSFLHWQLNSRRLVKFSTPLTVKAVIEEETFNHLLAGPSNPNYLLKEQDVSIVMESVEQAEYLLGICSHGYGSIHVNFSANGMNYGLSFSFRRHSLDQHVRKVYREIGSLVVRLRDVDFRLRALGAIPTSRSKIIKLDPSLVQTEVFDKTVKEYQAKIAETELIEGRSREDRELNKQALHAYLCSNTRVDRSKREAAFSALVAERIDILLQLSQYDPDEFPVVVERDFK
jgi:hypothetical protein